MVNFFNRLQKIYDKEIRECCDEKKEIIIRLFKRQ